MLAKVNGRPRHFDHLSAFRKVGRYEYSVTRYGTVYTIWGGKHSGGRRDEWYAETAEWTKAIRCTSLIDALRMLDTM